MDSEDILSTTIQDAERIYSLWDLYLRENNMTGMAGLYALDATLQSPLVPTFYGPKTTIVRGRHEIARFLSETVRRRPEELVHWHRDGFHWNGQTLIWEYPAYTPEGFQIDLAECMDLVGGLIQRHRIYWGWYAVEQIKLSTIKKMEEGRLNSYPLGFSESENR